MDSLGLSAKCIHFIYLFSAVFIAAEGIYYLVRRRNLKRRLLSSLFWPYILIVLSLTLIDRTTGSDYRYELELFWSYRDYYAPSGWAMGKEVVNNILMLFPFGVLCPLLLDSAGKGRHSKHTILYAFLFSLLIELVQLVTKRGLFEFDDIYHNTMGAVGGYYIYLFLTFFRDPEEGR